MTRLQPLLTAHDRDDQASVWCLRFAEGELSPREQAAFSAWLDEDPGNPDRFDEAVHVWRAMETVSLSPDLLTLRRSALDGLERAQRRRWTRGPRLYVIAGSIAATVLVCVFALGLVFAQMPKVYETGVGERRVVVLADGSSASLDAATRLSVRYRDDRRELTLEQGRAKFEVARDPLRPFSVTAADKVVVATGTEFSVELLDRKVHVILYEGHVAVVGKPATRDAAPTPVVIAAEGRPADHLLTPGREMTLTVDQPTAEVATTDPARSLSWEAGQLVFEDEPLASAVARVNRYAQVPIELADGRVGLQRVDGVFAAGDTQAFVEGVTGVLPIEARTRDGRTILASRP